MLIKLIMATKGMTVYGKTEYVYRETLDKNIDYR